MDFFDKFKIAKEALARKNDRREAQKIEREKTVRLDELTVKFHQVGPVKLPIPSLYAMKWLDERYGELDRIDLSGYHQLAAVIWILENQHRADEISNMNQVAVEAAINKRAGEISAAEHLHYLMAVQEIFLVVKKNYLRQQRSLLEPLLEALKSDFSPPGA